jgi:hypothetical protein
MSRIEVVGNGGDDDGEEIYADGDAGDEHG